MTRTGSGQSMPVKSRSSSAYFVIRRNHCSRSRFSTCAPQRQQRRSAPSTCSRASVPSLGHQSTGGLRAVGQAGLQEAQEEPLVPAVVGRVAGDDLGVPVEGGAHDPQLAAHVLDVAARPLGRVDPVLDRRVLGRQAEGVEADREEDVVAVHPPEAGERVGRRLDVPVADVQVARRVGVHRQQVVLRPRRVARGPSGTGRAPPSAPASAARWRRGRSARSGSARWSRRLASACDDPPPIGRGVVIVGVSGGWWSYGDSNPGPSECHSDALPAEL